jgi:hypothetical protein
MTKVCESHNKIKLISPAPLHGRIDVLMHNTFEEVKI